MADPSADSSQDGGLAAAELPNQTGDPAPAFEDDDDGMFFGKPSGTIGDGFGLDQSSASPPAASPSGSMSKKQDNGKPFSSFFEQSFGGGGPASFSQQSFLGSNNHDGKGFYDDKHLMGTDDKGALTSSADDMKDVFYGLGKQKPVVYDADSVAEWMAGKAQRPVLGMSSSRLILKMLQMNLF
jgi:hypothetical protein